MKADVVVIGAGVNGMVAAALLARAGRRVIVCDALERPGGLSAPISIHPGFELPGVLHDTTGFHADLAALLELDKYGFEWDAPTPVHCVGPDHAPFELWADLERGSQALNTFSPADARAYKKTFQFIQKIKRLLSNVLSSPPPPLIPGTASDMLQLGARGLALRRLGKRDMLELLRIAPMCVADWLQERFEHPALVEALAASAMHRSFAGPWSAGTCALLLMKWVQEDRPVKGGVPVLVEALQQSASAAGVEFRLNTEVETVELQNNRVFGVRLGDGSTLEASRVLATNHPRELFTRLLPPDGVEPGLVDRIKSYRSRGITAFIHFAMDGDIELKACPGVRPHRLRIGLGHVDRLEQCFDAVKYGHIAEQVHLEVSVPSLASPALAPEGKQVLTAWVGFVPPLGEERETPSPEELIQFVQESLNHHIVDFKARVLHTLWMGPAELEEKYHLPGGHVFHGEHALDQLFFMRPTFDCAQYRTPIEGLFLGGSASHPGGGLSGLPGFLAANALLSSDSSRE